MRALAILRAALGAVYLLVPQWIPGLLLGIRLDSRARLVVRILGARHLLQAAVLGAAAPSRLTRRLGSVVDALHAGSMLALAGLDERRRRAALGDAAVAGSLAAAGWVQASRSPTTEGH